jgi:Sulfotransferase domain
MNDGGGRLPTFLIIGAMRSGTTSLTRYLRAHPEVCMAMHKEVHFFDQQFDRGTDWYRSCFRCHHEGHETFEATQNYMYDEASLRRMADVVPAARLVAILRNPVDRAYSHYWLNRARNREPLEFREALKAEPDRLADGSLHDRFLYSYIDRGRYARQLLEVESLYPKDHMHVVLFEDLRDTPAEAFRDVCRFLDIDDSVVPPNLGTTVNPYVTFRSLAVRRLIPRLPGLLGRAVGKVNTRSASYPPMDPDVRVELVRRFGDDRVALEAWLGRDLSVWRA